MHGEISPATRCFKHSREDGGYDNGYGLFGLNIRGEIEQGVSFKVGPFSSFQQYQAVGASKWPFALLRRWLGTQNVLTCSALVQWGNGHQGMTANLDWIVFNYKDVQDIRDDLGLSTPKEFHLHRRSKSI